MYMNPDSFKVIGIYIELVEISSIKLQSEVFISWYENERSTTGERYHGIQRRNRRKTIKWKDIIH